MTTPRGPLIIFGLSTVCVAVVTTADEAQDGSCDLNAWNVRYVAEGLPLPAPRWPQDSSFTDVTSTLSLHPEGEDTEFVRNLARPSVVVDLGFGDGHFLSSLKEARRDVRTIGVGVTTWNQTASGLVDYIYVQSVPEDPTLLVDTCGRADLVVELFGPSSFGENPLHVLIYAALMLTPTGTYMGVSSLLPQDPEYSAYGNGETREKIRAFFQEEMGASLSFEVKEVSAGLDHPIRHLILHLHGGKRSFCGTHKDATIAGYSQLLQAANTAIGRPTNREVLSEWGPFNFGPFRASSKQYAHG